MLSIRAFGRREWLLQRAQWLSGRVLDSRSRFCGFEPHRGHCVVALSMTLYHLLSTGSAQKDVDWDVKNQSKTETNKSIVLSCQSRVTVTYYFIYNCK